MISERNADVKIRSTMGGEKIAMDIAAGAKAHIMAILTNLYGNRKRAVLREYSTNAYDSHLMAGQTRPIEITIPTPNAPLGSRVLRIKDFGVGLSVDELHAVYSQYGESTKNNSNDYNGMLGLGSKSVLTYTNQAAITAVQNGIRAAVTIGLDEDGLPTMNVIETRSTDEPNGVEVVIPVKGNDDFMSEAVDFFQYWPEGSVLLNGAPVKRFEGLKVSDGLWIVEGRQSYVLMGNVTYPADIEHGMSGDHALICEVPIGAVNFTPSREALMDTARTRETLAGIESNFRANIQAATQRDINAATTPAEAIERMYRWEETMARGARGARYHYKGREIPREFGHSAVKITTDGIEREVSGMVRVPYHKHKLSQYERPVAISSRSFSRTIWFTGFDLAGFNANHRKKIDQWLMSQPDDIRNVVRAYTGVGGGRDAQYILLKDTPPAFWIDPKHVVPWATIAAIRLNPVTSNGKLSYSNRITGSYDIIRKDDAASTYVGKYGIPAKDFDQAKPILHMRGNVSNGRFYAAALDHFYPNGYTLVCMGENRLAKFRRDFPKSPTVLDALKTLCEKWVKAIPEDHRIGLAMADEYGAARELRALDPALVDDPDLKIAGRIAELDLTSVEAVRKMVVKTLGRDHLSGVLKWTNPLNKYPLYDAHHMRDYPDHVYHYLNSAFAANATI